MFIVDDLIAPVTKLATDIIDRVIPDPAQAAQAKIELLKMQNDGALKQLAADTQLAQGQIDVDKAEATSPNFMAANWRPFIGWVCGVALAAQFIVFPILAWATALLGKPVTPPTLDMGSLMTLLFGMLGLGYMRTQEKLAGKAGAVS